MAANKYWYWSVVLVVDNMVQFSLWSLDEWGTRAGRGDNRQRVTFDRAELGFCFIMIHRCRNLPPDVMHRPAGCPRKYACIDETCGTFIELDNYANNSLLWERIKGVSRNMSHLHDLLSKSCKCRCCEPSGSNLRLTGEIYSTKSIRCTGDCHVGLRPHRNDIIKLNSGYEMLVS